MNPEGVAAAVCDSSLVLDRVFEGGDVELCTSEDVAGDALTGWPGIWLGSTITPGAAGADVEVCERADVATLPVCLLVAPSAGAF